MKTPALILTLGSLLWLPVGPNGIARAQDDASAERLAALESAKSKLTDHSYRLRYRFAPGETFRTKVTHLVAIETTIRGVTETAKTRSVSTKAWKITDVDAKGNITLTYSVEDVDMWQQLSGRQEVRYNSAKDDKPPPEYRHVAESVGVPMATVTISPAGRIIKRQDARPQFNPAIGELTVPLPEHAVKVGYQWATTTELALRPRPDTPIKRVKVRQLRTLKQVQAGVATIEVETQVLTPINDPAIRAQLVQRIKKGEIKFDVDAGRLLSQQMDMDETVIGFSGPDSLMKYLARLTEEAISQESVAGRSSTSVN